jgi:outer membrane protein TolC
MKSWILCLGVIALAGCLSTRRSPLPASPTQRCEVQQSAQLANALKSLDGPSRQPDPSKVLTLPELIDLAQSHNRSTRIAWENARQAAALSGLSRAEYYPMLAVLASYGGGAWDLNLRTNNNLAGIENQPGLIGSLLSGIAPSDISLNQDLSGAFQTLKAGVALRWLLFDFGSRTSLHKAAVSSETASKFVFNAAHQTVVFKVTEAYYALEAARSQTHAAESAAASAAEIYSVAEDRFRHGLITEPLLLQANQAKAQADFELATSAQNPN